MFHDRVDAGRQLASRLASYAGSAPVVLGLPRGGIPVAAQVARSLGAPLEVIGVRKLGAPEQPELAFGAIAEGGVRWLDEHLVRLLGVDDAQLHAIEARERDELRRRVRRYRGDRPLPDLTGRTAIVVDDGLATGATARAACRAVRTRSPERIVLAVPVASPRSLQDVIDDVDKVIALRAPGSFRSVGQFYSRFDATSDAEVVALLAEAGVPGAGA